MERNASGRCGHVRTSRANQGQSGLSERSIVEITPQHHTSSPHPSPPPQASLLASLGVMFSQDTPILPPTHLASPPSPGRADCRDCIQLRSSSVGAALTA